MSEDISSKYIESLVKKNEKLSQILDYTKSKNFQTSEKEIEHIGLYLRKRKRLFSELDSIIQEIKQFEEKEEFNIIVPKKEVSELSNQSNEIIKEIIELDKLNQKIFQNIFSIVKSNIKGTKDTGRINQMYLGVYDSSFIGTNFDSSR